MVQPPQRPQDEVCRICGNPMREHTTRQRQECKRIEEEDLRFKHNQKKPAGIG